VLALTAIALVASPAFSASAQEDCMTEPRAPIEVTPASGGGQPVPFDSTVSVRYAAGYFGPDGPGDPPSSLFTLVACGRCGVACSVDDEPPIPGLVQTQGDVLVFLPDGGLAPNTQYRGRATGVDDILPFDFCTSSASIDSLGLPVIGTFGAPTSTPVAPNVLSCLPDGGYRIAVFFEPATYDGPRGSIEYLLFQTRGTGVDEPRLVDRLRNFSGDRITMTFLLSPAEARTPVCYQVVVLDGLGHATLPVGDGCIDPLARVTFQGACSASPGRSTPGGAAVLLSIVALALVRRRR
jgi:MYXO-CTERM domain-containing protein